MLSQGPVCVWFVGSQNGCCSNKQTLQEWLIVSIVAIFHFFLLQVITVCLISLHCSLCIPYLSHDSNKHTHIHTQVRHQWWCEPSLYGRCCAAQGGIWSFSPLSRWNVNTPVAWICQMSTWYFKVASLLWLFFSLTWGGRQGCSALCRLTHQQACTPPHAYTHFPLFSTGVECYSGSTGWDRPAGPTQTHIHTLIWLLSHTQKNACSYTPTLWPHTHMQHSVILSPGLVFSLYAV